MAVYVNSVLAMVLILDGNSEKVRTQEEISVS